MVLLRQLLYKTPGMIAEKNIFARIILAILYGIVATIFLTILANISSMLNNIGITIIVMVVIFMPEKIKLLL